MSNDFLSQILGSVLGGGANGGGGAQGLPGGLGGLGALVGGAGGGGLGGMLGSMLGGQSQQDSAQPGAASGGGLSAGTLTMLLPLAMQWVQSNGGLGAVLQKFQQNGYSQQASSWVSTGANEPVDAKAVSDVMGSGELSKLAEKLGVSQDVVAGGMAQILPHVVNHLTPEGGVPANADDVLGAGLASIEKMFGQKG